MLASTTSTAWSLALAVGLLACAVPTVDSTANYSPHDLDRALEARVYIEANYDEVWARFTRAQAFEDWYTAPCVQFGSLPGDDLIWAVGDREIYRGKLLWIEEGRGLGWEFQFVGFGLDDPMSRVDVEITENGPVVLVALRHDVSDAPGTAQMISEVGWTKPLSRLKTLLETGEAMPWPEDGSGGS